MASIRRYRTSRGEPRYEVRYRDAASRQRSKAFTTARDARAFKLDVERRQQTGGLYQAEPELFGRVADAWLERYEQGAASQVRPRPRSIATVREVLPKLEPLFAVRIDQLRRAVAEDLITQVAADTPRRAEMALSLLKRILRSAEERGQPVHPALLRVRIARAEQRYEIQTPTSQAAPSLSTRRIRAAGATRRMSPR